MATGVYAMRWGLTAAADIPLEFDGAKFQLKAGEPNAKHGGVVRMGIPIRPPHFDLHQSGTIFNLGAMGCMFDNLIRHDPRDGGKTIIPDLAHSWQIAKDGKTYTFLLRDDVQFHDSTQLTADDVKATFDRIAKPPQGISIPRSILFKAVSEINARDKYTVEFKLSEPRPVNFMMSAIASGWNVICARKRWKTTVTTSAKSRSIRAPVHSVASSKPRTKSGRWKKTKIIGIRNYLIWTE